jgi:antitoxin (DNA-binding transcriptional repressor) of toxin-antitoxin stability system
MKPLQNNDPESTNALGSAASRLGSRELRASLSRSLRRAAAGERIVITDGGVPVAQLGPLDSPGQSTMDELVARGLVVPPRRSQPLNTTPLNTTRVIDSPIEVWSGVRLEQVVRDLR